MVDAVGRKYPVVDTRAHPYGISGSGGGFYQQPWECGLVLAFAFGGANAVSAVPQSRYFRICGGFDRIYHNKRVH